MRENFSWYKIGYSRSKGTEQKREFVFFFKNILKSVNFQVSKLDIESFMKKHNIVHYYETSAKENIGVTELFDFVLAQIMTNYCLGVFHRRRLM